MRYSPHPVKHYVRPGGGPGARFQLRPGAWNMAWLILPDVEDVKGYERNRMEDDVINYLWRDLEEVLEVAPPLVAVRKLFSGDCSKLMMCRLWTEETIACIEARAHEAQGRLIGVQDVDLSLISAPNVIAVDFNTRKRI